MLDVKVLHARCKVLTCSTKMNYTQAKNDFYAYSIRVHTTDQGGLDHEEAFITKVIFFEKSDLFSLTPVHSFKLSDNLQFI